MYKWITLLLIVAGAAGFGSEQTDWLEKGAKLVRQVENVQSGNWGAVLPVLYELATGQNGAESETENDQPSRNANTQKSKKSYSGRVSRVYDGDTIHVIDQNGQKHKIRMAYIDAPEIKQAYGTRSRDELKNIALDEKVKVRVFDIDRYQREVAQVLLGNTDLNLRQVKQGAAWHYESYARKQQNRLAFADYASAQTQAQDKRKGLWRERNPQAPWDFRRENNAQGQNKSSKWFGLW